MAESKPAAYDAVAAGAFVAAAERVKPHTKLIALLALGHFVIDVNQGSLPAMLPFLKQHHALSYAQAAMILLAANLTSSIVQPLFGYLSDQLARRWILPASVFVSGAGIALLGLAPGYPGVLALVVVMGLGVAAWHPEGYKTATGVAGNRKATALSWFSLGGNVGIALGPPLITFLITGLGPEGTLGMLLPAVLVGMLLVAVLPMLSREAAPVKAAAGARREGAMMPRAMALLILVVSIRAWASFGFTTFVPFYYVDTLKADPRIVGLLLFVFLGAGALGTVVAGPIADRIGTAALHEVGVAGGRPVRRALSALERTGRVRHARPLRRRAHLELLGVDRARPVLSAAPRRHGVRAHRGLRHRPGRRRGDRARLGGRPLGRARRALDQCDDAVGRVRPDAVPARAARSHRVNDRLPLQDGEQVLLIDQRGKRHLIFLRKSETFHSDRGWIQHDAVIGQADGSWVRSSLGLRYLALRPTLAEFVLDMPRGAQVIYPKDLAMILFWADIYPGCRVLEAGTGSGALTLALLRAVGPEGRVITYEQRDEFARRALANIHTRVGEVANLTMRLRPVEDGLDDEESVDRVVFDLPEPWKLTTQVARVLRPGGILLTYVPTIIQSHQIAETLNRERAWALVETFETLVRPWNIEGTSVRPFHRMVAHTGFITVARRVVPEEGVTRPPRPLPERDE